MPGAKPTAETPKPAAQAAGFQRSSSADRSPRLDPAALWVARVRDDLVVLDLAAGVYDVALGVLAKAVSAADARSAVDEVLGPCGWSSVGELQSAAVWAPPPQGDLSDDEVAVRWKDVVDFGLAWLTLAATYPGRPLRRLLRTTLDRGLSGVEAETQRRAAVFVRLLPFAPFPGACLWRAYLLRLFLRRGGCDATWVFGVRTWPFRAHCWLEADGVVLNDDARAVRPYVPILRA